MIAFSRARLRPGVDGSTGALVSYLSRNAGDIGGAHHLVWSLFGNCDGKRPFLFRMTGPTLRDDVLVYSSEVPQDATGLWEIESKQFEPRFEPGQTVSFSIRVNPTVCRDGKRHDLVMDARSRDQEVKKMDRDRVAGDVVPEWLAPRLAKAGLDLMRHGDGSWMTSVSSYSTLRFSHPDGHRVRLSAVDVTGFAKVIDPALVGRMLLKGIGRGGAYGCGMLLLKRAG